MNSTDNVNPTLEQARRFLAQGNINEAERLYLQLTATATKAPQAFHELGLLRFHQRRNQEALALIDSALAIVPGDRDAWINRGNVLKAMGRTRESFEAYGSALEIDPDCPEAHFNQGVISSEGGAFHDALASYGKALRRPPSFQATIFNNKGTALWKLKRFDEALVAFDQALLLVPQYVDALVNRSVLLRDMQRLPQALVSAEQAVSIDKGNSEAWYTRGNILLDWQRLSEARDSYLRALMLNPHHRHAPSQVASLTLQLCDWSHVAKLRQTLEEHIRTGASLVSPFSLLGYEDDPSVLQECAISYVRDQIPFAPAPLWTGEQYGHDRIKLAYLSNDFRRHATASLIADLIEHHDRARFEVVGISFGPDDGSSMYRRLSGAFDQFHDVRGLDDKAAAQLIRGLEVDIAVDLHGHTRGSRLPILSHRPAPVQVNYLGFPGSTGAGFIDYIIADQVVLPPEQQSCFSEKVAYLADCYQANDPGRAIDQIALSRRDENLPENAFVFCCFNGNWKITAPIFDAWMRILAKVPDSILWLIEDNAAACSNLRMEANRRGVSPDRLNFAPRTDLERHLARHRLADLFLDTLPVNAHTTACDALMTGLPLLTCEGRSFAGRVASSLLRAAELSELVAHDWDEYEKMALQLATDRKALGAIREKLKQRQGPLFDADKFRRNIEDAYTRMWRLAESGAAPESFRV